MNTDIQKRSHDSLFDRVVSILEEARSNVVRAVNTNMVLAYWLIGREIVQELQRGEERADYGKRILEDLSSRLKKRYGSGYSLTSLKYFRTFYQVYQDRLPEIGHSPSGDQSAIAAKGRPSGDELITVNTFRSTGFSPQLSWSHYRALMRVKNDKARPFYEKETIECGWSKAQLERQIHSSYYERILSNRGEAGLTAADRERLPGTPLPPETILKSPYVLEFLGLPDSPILRETTLEGAIITHLQNFLLELGKGFAFVGRQKRLRFDDTDLYVDLVFYHCILKCYLLIDLKMGELSYKDVGQMDGYVRMFDDLYTADDDNPTIGLVLCTKKNEAVAKYSVLSERKQIFASKYMLYLPTEEQLKLEIEKERRLIEEYLEEKDD
jgi:predicted nuclease of restriction endonuclease-like (RecB) superfamily